MRRKLIIPNEALKDISQLISLSEEQLRKLYNLLDSQDAASEEFGDLLFKVGKKLDVSNEKALDLINVANNLTAQRQNFRIHNEDFISELRLLIENHKPELVKEIDTKKDLILKLTGHKRKAESFDKKRFLQTGLIDTAKSFKSICDIRPIFNEDRNEILDLIPIIVVEVGFEEKDHESNDRVVFQLNEGSFEKLKDSIKNIERKLDVIKSFIKSKKEGT